VKKKTIQPLIGKGGKYRSIFKKIIYSTGKISDPVGQEELLRNWLANPDVPGVIASYEKLALFIIENEGYHFKKPYNYPDLYEKKNGWHGILSKIKDEIGTEEWSMTYAGRAAKILDYCQDLRSHMEGGNITKTAHYAMLLQQEVDHLIFMPADLPANIGQGQRLSGGKTKYSDEDKIKWLTRFRELRQKNSRMSVSSAAKNIARKTGHGYESIRTYISKNK